ncbi:CaiB/BaiF CoA transferase family protein [Pseudomonas sp. NPDC086251]|uniref:CaiB/BaiF CoA transferase family protein n=1 Tax=Pseudomonas sp. NPDC086251 TaxID=3364431 RepID=UPI003834A3FE
MSQDESIALSALPLNGMRVIELANGKTDMAARVLADLGAQVILVEPPQGDPSRTSEPLLDDASLYFVTHHANKQSVVIDLQDNAGREAFKRLLQHADLLIDGKGPGVLDALGLGFDALREHKPDLLQLSISDFGLTGPYRDYKASHAVHTAMGGVLCRSGKPGHSPLLPPGKLCWESAAIQASWVALLGHWQRLQAGVGDHLDFSIHEAIAQLMDPGLGVTGSAAAGKSALDSTPHGRPPAVPLYPIVACRDGYMRLCVLNPRQWQGMCEWLGEEHPFRDPMFSNIAKRMPVAHEINALIGKLFSQSMAVELLAEGQRRGVPLAIVATPAQVLQDEHFAVRDAFDDLLVAPGRTGRVPSGYLEIDGQRAGIRKPAPALGEHDDTVWKALAGHVSGTLARNFSSTFKRRPLEGIRVLDLGVIIAGAEAGRLMADQGAEVIKVENRAFPDGGRQSMTGEPITPSIAQGHRNKLSMGINLRSEAGRLLFKQLVEKSDVLLSNFKPGTLESLSLGYDVLKEVNPRLVMLESSAMGNTGPQSRTLGYGPLVRASTGLASLWRAPELPDYFADGVTTYPDHLAARVGVTGVLALLIRRERTGLGGNVSLSQAEIFLNANAEQFLEESLQPGSFVAKGNTSRHNAPEGIYPCSGDDQWCAISVTSDAEWQQFLAVIQRRDLLDDKTFATRDGRLANQKTLDALVTDWTLKFSPREVTENLQSAGLSAGFMQRLSEYREDPQFTAREFIASLEHPGLPAALPTENRIVQSLHMPAPTIRPAPYQAEHTRELATRLLGLRRQDIETLIADGHLEDMAPLSEPALKA